MSRSSHEDDVTIAAPEALRNIGFLDLNLPRFQIHEDPIVLSIDVNTQKPLPWTEINHLVTWCEELLSTIQENFMMFAVLDLMKGHDDYPISKAKYHVNECLQIIESAISFEAGLDITHPDTRGQNYGVVNLMFDDSTCLIDLVRQIFASLFGKCVVRVVVKTNQFLSSTLATLLVDTMQKSGAIETEIKCLALDRRESLGSEMKFIKTIGSRKTCKLSTIAAVFKETDTFAAAQGIIESYFREQYPNMVVLVEESSYERFIKDWQRYYSHALAIGCRLDTRSSVVDVFNEKVSIDLCAIDIRQSHKMSGNVINVLKFRTLADLMSILKHLRKVPYMTLWNDDLLLLREFCLRVNISQEFWLNHIPRFVANRQFPDDMGNLFADSVALDMADLYNIIAKEYGDELIQTRKVQAQFMKKDPRLRTNLIIHAYTNLLQKNKSLKNGLTPNEAVARLRRFQIATLHSVSSNEPGDSRIETIRRPIGLAILHVRDETTLKAKQILVEMIFKNLLIGNGILLVSSHQPLGAKFAIENDHVIPFKMVQEPLPDIANLSLNTTIDTDCSAATVCIAKKQCPNNTYAIEVTTDMSSETCEAYTICLGTRSTRMWFPDAEASTYWSLE